VTWKVLNIKVVIYRKYVYSLRNHCIYYRCQFFWENVSKYTIGECDMTQLLKDILPYISLVRIVAIHLR